MLADPAGILTEVRDRQRREMVAVRLTVVIRSVQAVGRWVGRGRGSMPRRYRLWRITRKESEYLAGVIVCVGRRAG
jgi:hypothetical protein